ncbi:DUF6629 family protein [Nocardioides sp. Leaf285]|uniref:DUF6629 family protein n=1 Tax=Nocardioides sp. Leaf285 TaxID=1736322 RepID=UPI0007033A42|nr:DUF6629 family protein [Nocardioides sp. Leaf285]KQP62708.1 hypothetical protein ASF47_19890 [Nocardioides sp. Leaf285]
MCFSLQADLVAGAVVLPLGALALREVRAPRELPLPALPVLFAVHQLVEALVWAGADGLVSDTTAHRAALAYVVFALPFLPLYLPLAVLLVARPDRRGLVAPFVALGGAVGAYMAWHLWTGGVRTTVRDHAIVYYVGLGEPEISTGLYIVAVVGACVLAGHRWITAFGLANLVGLLVVGYAYADAFASLWCVWAAVSSVLILVHLARVERGADPRGDGESLQPRTDAAR